MPRTILMRTSFLSLLLCLLLILGCGAQAAKAAALSDALPFDTSISDDAMLNVSAAENRTAASSSASDDPAFSLIWFSDPQGYSEYYPDIFYSMTNWIASNAKRLNAKVAICTGDFVNTMDDDKQWNVAMGALQKLEGVIPLFPVAGNHDILHDEAIYDTYFKNLGQSAKKLAPADGYYAKGRGSYKLVNAGSTKLLLIGLGYSVEDDGIKWLNSILDEYPDRKAILCFHGYMDPDGSYTSDGLKLYNDVVTKHSNIFMVLCGHRHGVFRRTLLLDNPNNRDEAYIVHELIVNYQDEEDDGSGYLCVLDFSADASRVHVWTYSPYLNDYNLYPSDSGKEDFTLKSAG